MSKKIVISEAAVNDILKKITRLNEEINLLFRSVDKAVLNAEMEGWNDKNYLDFINDYTPVKRNLQEGVRQIEDILIPKLKKMLRSIQDFG